MDHKIELTYYKVRCTKTDDIVAVYISTIIWDGYKGWLVCNPYRCQFEKTDQAEYETLKAFFAA